jgi:hypothetical protein
VSDKNKAYLFGTALVLLVLVAGYFGVKLPNPPIPEPLPITTETDGARGLSRIRIGQDVEMAQDLAVTGNQTVGGTLSMTGATTLTGALAANGGAVVAGPTADATATPAMLVNNLGAANDNLVVAKAGTPVFKVSNAGVVTGNVLQYGSSGQKIVCGSTNITGTGTIAHGLATPVYVMASLAGDVTGDAARVSTTNAVATVTVKVWNSALTPAPNTTPVAVNWCVVGTP